MSRILMATAVRQSRDLCNNSLKSFLRITRQLAAKTPSKSSSVKCSPNEPPKPKPGHFPSGGTHAVFSDLPQPEGDFVCAWKAKNSKYNMVLLSGLAAVIGALALTIGSGKMRIYSTVPDYPYTEEEMEEFAKEEERRQMEKAEREQRRQNMIDAKELKVRRRKAKDAMEREVQLMQKDLDGGINEPEMEELLKLTQEREEFENWEKEEVKRLSDKEKEREDIQKEVDKARKEQQKKQKG